MNYLHSLDPLQLSHFLVDFYISVPLETGTNNLQLLVIYLRNGFFAQFFETRCTVSVTQPPASSSSSTTQSPSASSVTTRKALFCGHKWNSRERVKCRLDKNRHDRKLVDLGSCRIYRNMRCCPLAFLSQDASHP